MGECLCFSMCGFTKWYLCYHWWKKCNFSEFYCKLSKLVFIKLFSQEEKLYYKYRYVKCNFRMWSHNREKCNTVTHFVLYLQGCDILTSSMVWLHICMYGKSSILFVYAHLLCSCSGILHCTIVFFLILIWHFYL